MPRFIGQLIARVVGRFIGYLRTTGEVTATRLSKYHFFRGVVSYKLHVPSGEALAGILSRFAGRLGISTKPIIRHSLSRLSGAFRKRIVKLRKRDLGVLSRFIGTIAAVTYPFAAKRMFGTLTLRYWLQKPSITGLIGRLSGYLTADKVGLDWFARLVEGLLTQAGTLTRRIWVQESVTGLMEVFSGAVTFGAKRVHNLIMSGVVWGRLWNQKGLVGVARLRGILTLITTAIYRYPRSFTGRARFSGMLYVESTSDLIETLYYGPDLNP